MPLLANGRHPTFFNGPESFTPDDRYLLGEAPELRNFFVAAGFNSIGIQSAGGAGKVLAEWIVDGQPPIDLWDVDIRRGHAVPEQPHATCATARSRRSACSTPMHWPYRQFETARGVRRSPLHERLAARGACFGEVGRLGARQLVRAATGVEPEYDYSCGRQNWFEHSARGASARARGGRPVRPVLVRQIPASRAATPRPSLNRICANDVAVPAGRIVYTQWLNERGGIEADLTVTRVAEDRFLVVTGAATQTRDLAWLRAISPRRRCAVPSTSPPAYAVLGVMGPRSRDLLSRLTDADLSNAAFPFGTSQVDRPRLCARARQPHHLCRRARLGALCPDRVRPDVFDASSTRASTLGLQLAGYHAMNSLRIEKAYRHWGHDITDEDTPAGGGPRLRGGAGTRRAASSAATRCCASATPASRAASCSSRSTTAAAALPQRADLARRCPGRAHHVGHVRPQPRQVARAGLRHQPQRAGGCRVRRRRPLRGRDRR